MRPRVDARNALPGIRMQMRRLPGANQGARRERLRRAPSACWQDGGWRKGARTSCRSGSETVRRSTTASVQGIGPACEEARILCTTGITSQHDSLSRANINFARLLSDKLHIYGPCRLAQGQERKGYQGIAGAMRMRCDTIAGSTCQELCQHDVLVLSCFGVSTHANYNPPVIKSRPS